jgi:glycosyltransferase involved in cell wall biosynthesis
MTAPIRILHLITSLNTGGTEIALLRLLENLDQQKFENHVISLIPTGPIGEQIRALGIPVTSLEMPPGRPTLRGFRQLLILLRRFKPHILQTWLYHADLLGLLAAKLIGVPTVVWNIRSAEMDFSQYRKLSGLVVRVCALLSGKPTAIIINSQAGLNVHTRLGYRPPKWCLIPNGIDTERFTPDARARQFVRRDWGISPTETLIGLVGRLDPMKDHPTFLKAAAIVQRRNPKARFVCIGDGPGPYLAELKELTEQLGLSSVLWPGPRADLPAVYNALDLLVSSSIGEGFPNVVAEAMACERPCVVTDVGDSAKMVAGTGVSVPPKNPEALAEAILQALELPETERVRQGQKARQQITEKFGLAQMVNAYQTLYENLS